MNKKILIPIIGIVLVVAIKFLFFGNFIGLNIDLSPTSLINNEEVVISTDKSNYVYGERVRISFKNNLNYSVFYAPETCGKSFWDLYFDQGDSSQFLEREVIDPIDFAALKGVRILSKNRNCSSVLDSDNFKNELKPNEIINSEWLMTEYYNDLGFPVVLVEPGNYYVSGFYISECAYSGDLKKCDKKGITQVKTFSKKFSISSPTSKNDCDSVKELRVGVEDQFSKWLCYRELLKSTKNLEYCLDFKKYGGSEQECSVLIGK